MRYIILVFLPVLLLSAVLPGQGPQGRAAGTPKRFSITLEIGPTVGGPGPGLADQLRSAGYDDTVPYSCLFGFCGGPTSYPRQEKPVAATGWSVRYTIHRSLGVGMGHGASDLGGAVGHRVGYVNSVWQAKTTWAGLFWMPLPGVRLGGGPAWYILSRGWGEEAPSLGGFMGEAGAETRGNGAFFFSLTARGHLVPAKDVQHPGAESVTLRPNWTHATLLVGIGVRL